MLSFMPAGTPSMVTPMAGPCDSPKIEMRKILPNEFIVYCGLANDAQK
jgi:hypothetical protein